jgi:class 3 adenylate cyclase
MRVRFMFAAGLCRLSRSPRPTWIRAQPSEGSLRRRWSRFGRGSVDGLAIQRSGQPLGGLTHPTVVEHNCRALEVHSELKLVTCLFIDIVGSTDAVVRLGPERMQRLLSDGFAQISGMIRAHGGVVEKYIGDAILGTFGIPIARPDDAERALRAAAACANWASEWSAAGGLSVRAGIETGDLLVDPRALETQQRMMLGEAINLAARLQQFALPGQIVVGPGCHEATAGVGRFEAMGPLDLKGLGSIEGWRFDGFHEAATAADVDFLGRQQELAALSALFDRARSGAPALALIVGPPGQGKSRLAREALRNADEFRVLEARCRPDAESGVNTPLRQLIEAEVGQATADAVRERLQLLLGEADGVETAAAISHGAGLLVSDELLAIGRHEQREIIARAWERYLARVTTMGPLSLLVEDVHWGDPQLLRVIDYIASSSVGALVVVATARPEFVGTALREGEGRIQLELGPLDSDTARRLAAVVGREGRLQPASLERAGGNPLFLIELARSEAAGARLPMNIQAAIAARLDELDAEDRHLLQHASVAGESFTIRDAALLDDRGAGAVVGSTARAAQLGFLVADGPGYRFYHALVRDVVYGRLPVAERMQLHARYATEGVDPADPEARAYHWWEALKPPDASWVWEDAARHAKLRADAYRTHLEAATRAEQHNAYEQALEFDLRAVELADTPADRAAAEAEVGRMYARQGRGDDGWAHRLRALDLYEEAGVTPPASLYANMLELVAFNWGYFHDLPTEAEVLGLLADGERIARASGDDESLAMLLAERASYTEDPSAGDGIKRLLASADPVPFADAAQRMATVYLWAGRIGDAIALFEDVFERLIPAGGRIFNGPDARAWYGAAAFAAGDVARARRIADDLDAETEHRSTHTRSHYFAQRALVDFGIGAWEDLLAVEGEVRSLADRNPDVPFCLLTAATIGYASATEVLASGPLRADLDAQLVRQVEDSEVIRAAAGLLPKVMGGDADALTRGLRAYQPGLPLSDRFRVWDPIELMPALGLTILERWDELAEPLAKLDAFDRRGARLAGAVAAAIREEQRAAGGGPPPSHEALDALGFGGISQILRFRPRAERAA